jgi:hypothetical protein
MDGQLSFRGTAPSQRDQGDIFESKSHNKLVFLHIASLRNGDEDRPFDAILLQSIRPTPAFDSALTDETQYLQSKMFY